MLDLETFQFIESHYPWVFPACLFILGACIGSFLNVCIYRIPNNESLIRPGSHNRSGDPIAWYDNIPILSWFILLGKDRKTGEAFSIRYPLVEMLTAVLFVLSWYLLPPAQAIGGMVFCSILIPASFIDLDHMLLPDRFTVGGACLGVALSAFLPQLHGIDPGAGFLPDALRGVILSGLGAIIGSGVVLWIMVIGGYILRKDVMGEGDIFFMGCIGAFCGWQGALFAIFGGALLGTVILIPLMILERLFVKDVPSDGSNKHKSKNADNNDSAYGFKFGTSVPFGPWLALGALLYYLWARPYVAAYFENLGAVLFP